MINFVTLLGPVDLCWLHFVRGKNELIEANRLIPGYLSYALFAKSYLTKCKTCFNRHFQAAFVYRVIDVYRLKISAAVMYVSNDQPLAASTTLHEQQP